MAITMETGNIYRDAVDLRLVGLTAKLKYARTIRWFYRKNDGRTTWTELTEKKQSIAAYTNTTTSAWCKIPRGTLSANTSYDFRALIDYSGTKDTEYYYKTVSTLEYIFKVGAYNNVLSRLLLSPVVSLGSATRVHLFKAPDSSVKANVSALTWDYVGSKVHDPSKSTDHHIFNVLEDYKKFDYKVILTNSSGTITNIVFIED